MKSFNFKILFLITLSNFAYTRNFLDLAKIYNSDTNDSLSGSSTNNRSCYKGRPLSDDEFAYYYNKYKDLHFNHSSLGAYETKGRLNIIAYFKTKYPKASYFFLRECLNEFRNDGPHLTPTEDYLQNCLLPKFEKHMEDHAFALTLCENMSMREKWDCVKKVDDLYMQ